MSKTVFIEFLDSLSTIPGTRYLRDALRDRKWGTSVMWIFTFLFNTSLCAFMISYLSAKYKQSQFIVTVDNSYPIDEVKFPCITICNQNIIYKKQMNHIDRILVANNQTRERIDRFYNDLSYLQTPPHPSEIQDNYTDILEILKTSHFTRIDEIMYEGRQSCESMLKFCTVNKVVKKCSDIFQMAKTKYGFCCQFNSAHTTRAQEMARGANASNREYRKPAKVLTAPEAGRRAGLYVIFKIEASENPQWSKPYGAKILISDANDFADESILHRRDIARGKEIILTLYATISHATTAVKRLPPAQRRCWLRNDKELFLESEYDFHMCLTDCRFLKVYSTCGCSPYYYMNPEGFKTRIVSLVHWHMLDWYSKEGREENKCFFLTINQRWRTSFACYCYFIQKPCFFLANYRICSFENIGCLHKFLMVDIDQHEDCDCEPECSDAWISPRHMKRDSRVRFSMERMSEVKATFRNYSSDDIEGLNVLNAYFDTDTCVRYTQDVLVRWSDLLAAYGGTVNFCLGGSIVTLFEILLFVLSLFRRKLAI